MHTRWRSASACQGPRDRRVRETTPDSLRSSTAGRNASLYTRAFTSADGSLVSGGVPARQESLSYAGNRTRELKSDSGTEEQLLIVVLVLKGETVVYLMSELDY